MHVVLVEPEIPPNTGNVARLCAATRSTLHLIEPFGFKLEDRDLKRAGMDYWQQVTWHRWKNWQDFEASVAAGILPSGTAMGTPSLSEGPIARIGTDLELGSSGRESAPFGPNEKLEPTHVSCYGASKPKLWFIEQGGAKFYSEAAFGPNDYLVFGRETAGLPKALLEANSDTWLRIPMFNPDARSLNLSNCVALVLFEALRQQSFPGGE